MGVVVSLTPAVLDAMVQAGCTAEQIAAAVKASMADEEARAEQKRAKDRERKRRQRAKEADECHAVSRGQSVTDCDGADNPLPLSPNENNSNPHTPSPEHKTRARKGHRLPIDWEPKPLPATMGAMLARWEPGEMEREMAKFRDWAASANGPNALKKDWDAAWRNWLRKHDEERKPTNARQHSSTANAVALARAAFQG